MWYVFLRRVQSYVVVGAVLLLAGCGLQDPDKSKLPKPGSSFSVVTNDYPGVVKVILPNNSGMCSGTFVSSKAVLTAAHCALDSGTYTIKGAVGNFTTSNRAKLGPGVVDDPNDLALLWLDEDVVDSKYVIPVGDTVSADEVVRLVGYGCNDIEARTGSGVKRTGTNQVWRLSDYLDLLTPYSSARGVLGPDNRAGSCFGDSGGPMLRTFGGGQLRVVGVAHAGGKYGDDLLSEYTNITRSDNWSFLVNKNNTYNLGIAGL